MYFKQSQSDIAFFFTWRKLCLIIVTLLVPFTNLKLTLVFQPTVHKSAVNIWIHEISLENSFSAYGTLIW